MRKTVLRDVLHERLNKYPEAAYAYAEQLLSDEGALGVPRALRYGVTTDVTLPQELRQDLLFNSPERLALKKKVDWENLIANRSPWTEELNKIIRTYLAGIAVMLPGFADTAAS
ncbi:hypothetical protein [Bradyrhizobium sp. JR19.8]|uniref:hypothetical protein n=1 Tax=Bradyrhizobium sp. JR19.8 TaxID=3156370 RepID=UPI0033923E6E